MRSLIVLSLISIIWAATISKVSVSEDIHSPEEIKWKKNAIKKLWEERDNMGHTPLRELNYTQIPGVPSATIFIKNETASNSGTLKHRFVWALSLWGIVEGKIKQNTTVIDSTSGNTGASEAYMCRLIGVPYIAVVSTDLEEEKIRQITQFGGKIDKVKASERNHRAQQLAKEMGGFFMNQFGNADSAEEFHESGDSPMETTNVFHEILNQLEERNETTPHYFVHSAGTGGTISSVGKYITRYGLPTQVVLADSQFSLFYDYVLKNKYFNISAGQGGRPEWVKPGVAGIGYGYNPDPVIFKDTTSLLRTVIDNAVRMPDMATAAAMRSLRDLGIDGGASTALNFLVALDKAILHKEGKGPIPSHVPLKVVLIMGDPGHFYRSSYFNDTYIDTVMGGLGGMKALNCWKNKIDDAILNGSNFTANADECR